MFVAGRDWSAAGWGTMKSQMVEVPAIQEPQRISSTSQSMLARRGAETSLAKNSTASCQE